MREIGILYESIPIARMGAVREHADQPLGESEVFVCADFSCFAYMLEEYIGYGAVSIVMPASAPEASFIDDMPPLLRNRILRMDDATEVEASRRILFGLRQSLGIKLSDSGKFVYPKDFPHDHRWRISKIHSDLRRLAFGFNHGVQIEINPQRSTGILRSIREIANNADDRAVLAQVEGLLGYYTDLGFDARTPNDRAPGALITTFDRLINDPLYLEYSKSISELSSPVTRQGALVSLRRMANTAKSKQALATGWDFLTKVIKVWTGVPLPESKEIGAFVKGRNLPPLIDMTEARQRAVETWRNSDRTNKPLRRSDPVLSGANVRWLPPLPSMKIGGPNEAGSVLGSVAELLAALEAEVQRDRE
jgi:hypothetical protein